MPGARDHVDVVMQQWERARPELDHAPRALAMRLARAARHLERSLDRMVQPLGLTACEYPVLSVLRRAGKPYRATPTEISRTLMLSSGAVTNRIDRLERAGLVVRRPDPKDRRGTLVQLTARGLEVVNEGVELQVEHDRRTLDALTDDERTQLDALLHKLLVSFEDEKGAESARAA